MFVCFLSDFSGDLRAVFSIKKDIVKNSQIISFFSGFPSSVEFGDSGESGDSVESADFVESGRYEKSGDYAKSGNFCLLW